MNFLKNYVNNIKEGFVPDDDLDGIIKATLSRIKNLWKHSIHGKITIILICLLAISFSSAPDDGTCDLAGCDRKAQGWTHVNESQGDIKMVGCYQLYTSIGYCSKNHCAKDQ